MGSIVLSHLENCIKLGQYIANSKYCDRFYAKKTYKNRKSKTTEWNSSHPITRGKENIFNFFIKI